MVFLLTAWQSVLRLKLALLGLWKFRRLTTQEAAAVYGGEGSAEKEKSVNLSHWPLSPPAAIPARGSD